MILLLAISQAQKTTYQSFALASLYCPIAMINSQGCTACYPAFFLATINDFVFCEPCPNGCSSCTNASVCTQCVLGFALNETTNMCQCNLESQGCIAPSDSNCPMGSFYSFALLHCISCGQNLGCQACSSAFNCTSCVTGFRLTGTTCTACPQFCSTCNQTACVSCFPGFSGQNCEQKQQGINLSCSPTFYYNMTTCVPCTLGLNCKYCKDKYTCTTCPTGYYLTAMSAHNQKYIICQPCPPSCTTCVSNIECTGCVKANSSSCLVNPCTNLIGPGCTSCSFGAEMGTNEQYTCTSCVTKMTLSTDLICQSCPSNCAACQSGLECLSCNQGYYLSQSKCLVCPGNCLTCNSKGSCSTCQLQYYYGNGQCLLCPKNCYYCQFPNECQVCVSNYSLSRGKCSKVKSNASSIIWLSVFCAILLIILVVMVYFYKKGSNSKRQGQYLEIV